MNKRNRLTRNSKHSHSELIQMGDKFINFAVRDFIALALFGLTQLLIDDTKKRTNEILTLKKRNEDRIQKVSNISLWNSHDERDETENKCPFFAENLRLSSVKWKPAHGRLDKLLSQ